MGIQVFLNNYREAFGDKVDLPIVFWYSEQPVTPVDKIGGCLFKCMKEVRAGQTVSFECGNYRLWWRKILYGFYGDA